MGYSVDGGLIAAGAIAKTTCDAPDSCHAHAREIVDFSVRQFLLQAGDHLPAINQGLQLRRSAKVFEEQAAFLRALQRDNGIEQCVFGTLLLAFGFVAIWFHSCINVLTYYYTIAVRVK